MLNKWYWCPLVCLCCVYILTFCISFLFCDTILSTYFRLDHELYYEYFF